MDQPITNGLTITLPARGETDWDENIKTYCFIPISSHNHEGNGSGNKLSNNALYNTTEHGAGNEAVDTNVIRDLAITRAKLAASLEADIAALEGLDANLVAFTGYQAPIDYDPAVEGTLLFRIETAEGIIENRTVSLGTAIAADGTYAGHSGSNYIDGNSSLTEDLTDLDTQVKTNEDNISSNTSTIASLATQGNLQGDAITDLETDVSSLQNRALSSLSDVSSASPSNGQALAWNDDLSAWQPQTISGGSGGGVAENSFVGIVTEWQEYTPTLSGFSVTSQKALYRRVGDTLEIIYRGNIDSVTSTMFIELPTGLSIDTNNISSSDMPLGTAQSVDQGIGVHLGAITKDGSTNNKLKITGEDGAYLWNASVPFTWATYDVISFTASIPILGWDAVGLIDQSGSVDVVASLGLTSDMTNLSSGAHTVEFDNIVTDTTSSFNSSTHKYKIPETGYYDISAGLYFASANPADTTVNARVRKGTASTDVLLAKFLNAHNTDSVINLSKMVYLVKDEEIYLEAECSDPTNWSIISNNHNTFLTIAKRNSSQAIISGSSSDLNYISNAKAVVNIAGWNEYDGTSATPSGTISGTASLTFERNEANPLRGSADFKLTTTSASLGEGVAYDFSVQRADLAKKMLIEFEYDASHSGYEDGDVKVFVYDVANSNLIRVNGEDLKGGKGTHFAQFQTSANGADYRLLFHVTSANVYSIYLDDIKVSPIGASNSVSNQFVGCKVVVSSDYNVTGSGDHRVQFDSALFDSHNAFNFTSREYIIPEAGYYQISALIAVKNAQGFFEARVLLNSGSRYFGGAEADNSGRLLLPLNTTEYLEKGTSVDIILNPRDNTGDDADYDIDGGTFSRTEFSVVKIPDLSLPESVGSGRDVFLHTQHGTGTSIPNQSYTTVPWDKTNLVDTTNSLDNNGIYTIPETGYYDISSQVWLSSNNDFDANTAGFDEDVFFIGLYINGSLSNIGTIDNAYVNDNQAYNYMSTVNTMKYLEKGQTVEIKCLQTSDSAQSIVNSFAYNWLTIAKRQSAQTVLETETVAAKIELSSNQSVQTNANVTVQFDDPEFDTHNAYDVANSAYIVPISGYYSITAQIILLNCEGVFNTRIAIDASSKTYSRFESSQNSETSTTNIAEALVNDIFYLEKGQSVRLYVDAKGAVEDSSYVIAGFSSAGAPYSHLSIARLK